MPTRALFFVLPENSEVIFSLVPFGMSLASFVGEAWVWLGHPYPFTRNSVVFRCAPARGTLPPRRWPAASPEPRAQAGGLVDAQTGMPVGVPLLCFSLHFYELIELESVEKYM